MARQKLSEFKAKSLIFSSIGLPYSGLSLSLKDMSSLSSLHNDMRYVLKVDQGIKKRFKLGLIALDIRKDQIEEKVKELARNGYENFIIEEFVEHVAEDERYVSFERARDGIVCMASRSGGVDIEEKSDQIKRYILPQDSSPAAEYLGIKNDLLLGISKAMDDLHISFVEINPLVVTGDSLLFLDMAIEVDDAGEFFVDRKWVSDDFVQGGASKKTPQEKAIEDLSAKSQASFRFVVLNPNGSIFMLLSGGGASIVLADEVFNKGLGKELANYGEYSGNPNAEETYLYTKELLSLLIQSTAKDKKLIIAGGVANFTDIRITFKGVIKAIDEVKDELHQQGIKVFVRRGGPYEKEGLLMMEEFLKKQNLYGFVSGPDLPLTQIVDKAIGGHDA